MASRKNRRKVMVLFSKIGKASEEELEGQTERIILGKKDMSLARSLALGSGKTRTGKHILDRGRKMVEPVAMDRV